jgi:hypothetical protein
MLNLRAATIALSAFAIVATAPDASVAGPVPMAGVAFVSCSSDGQLGPQEGIRDVGQAYHAPKAVASELAYYASADLGVLAPKGWHCFGLYGSNGATLIVTPEVHGSADLLEAPKLLTGPAVEVSFSWSSTAGRSEVAEVIARLFPSKRKFVDDVIDEGIEPKENFPFGPYPGDTVTHRSSTDVMFVTPAGSDGMGTASRLAKNGDPISGEVRLSPENDATVIDVRLPKAMLQLVPAILLSPGPSTP